MTAWLMAVAVLAGSPETPPTPVLATEATQEVGPLLQTGSLIFSKGDCLAIKVFSAGPYTHVAAVVITEEGPEVYDSTPGPGVRRLPLGDYLASQGTAPLYILQPREPFSAEQADKFERHLESQIGRPYSVTHHLTGRRTDGLHCAEFMTDALVASDLVESRCPPRVSPRSLHTGLLQRKLYNPLLSIQLQAPLQPEPMPTTWYGRMWDSTCACTVSCWRKLRGCVLCY